MDRESSSSKSNKMPQDGPLGAQDSIFCSFYRPLTQEALDRFWGTDLYEIELIPQHSEVCTLHPTPPPSPQRPLTVRSAVVVLYSLFVQCITSPLSYQRVSRLLSPVSFALMLELVVCRPPSVPCT